jgi:hypothetical protein
MGVVPCYRGGHKCQWPACKLDCDGRPGRHSSNPNAYKVQAATPMLDGTIRLRGCSQYRHGIGGMCRQCGVHQKEHKR